MRRRTSVIYLVIKVISFEIISNALCVETDYCDPELCPPGIRHIACNNTEIFSEKCGRQLVNVLPMTSKRKKLILGLHNELRDKIARGEIDGYPTAKRMSAVSWDDNLEFLARLHVKTCEVKHDQCRNTKKFYFVGQNIGIRITHPNFEKHASAIKGIVHAWFREYQMMNQSFIENYRLHPEGKQIGHFAAMVGDKTTRIGCACIVFIDPDTQGRSFMMTCNYSSNNFESEPVYKRGQPGVECRSGVSTRYKGLCKYVERKYIDKFTGLLE